jgi:hypothetical protein
MYWDRVTGAMQPSTAFCVWDFHTVSTVQRHCFSGAQLFWTRLYTNVNPGSFDSIATKLWGQN